MSNTKSLDKEKLGHFLDQTSSILNNQSEKLSKIKESENDDYLIDPNLSFEERKALYLQSKKK